MKSSLAGMSAGQTGALIRDWSCLACGTRCARSVLAGGSTAVGESTSGPNHWACGPAGSAGSGAHTPAWIRRPTHSIASYSARPQV